MKSFFVTLVLVMFFIASTFTTSFAQLPWTKDANNPILSGGASGSWNEHVLWPTVLYNADSTRYEMWFTATSNPLGNKPLRIGFAISPDGISWEMHPDPVLEPDAGTWDESLEDVRVIRENGQYKMWYVGYSSSNEVGAFGYATSMDGITWTKYLNNPVMTAGSAAWQARFLSSPDVLPFEGGYKMWYIGWKEGGISSNIGYATSPDGITWTPDTLNNPVLETGSAGRWDDGSLLMSKVLFIEKDSVYHMWYTGTRPNETPPEHIGWATSADGIEWNKHNYDTTTSTLYLDSDPVLKSISGQWDGTYIHPGTVMLEGDSLRMWYSGSKSPISTFLNRIGHATAPYTGITGFIETGDMSFPELYYLMQNYPNPFNPSTKIEYTLPKTEHVTITVYNTLGQVIETLVNKPMPIGHHHVEFNSQSLPSGVYFYRIEAGEYVQTRKMLLVK